jgi:hypothetical protein
VSEFHPTAEQERECLRRLGTRPAGVSDAYKPSLKHLLADAMLGGSQRHMMEVGGSRSGKTFGLVKATCTRAISAPESRHAIFRLRFNAVKQSIGMDTLPKVMRLRYPHIKYGSNKSDQFFRFYNKTRPKADASELWLAGLDDKERVERVLGKEYVTLYFNECSQIPYHAITTAMTRLAQKIEFRDAFGVQRLLVNRAYFDLNPVGTTHWSYKLFVEHKSPDGLGAILDPEEYVYLYVNPTDNADNVDPKYIASLRALPEKQRRRFFEGKYVAQIDGALWTLEIIEQLRYSMPLTWPYASFKCEADLRQFGDDRIPNFQRIVVAVDPSGAAGEFDIRRDEIGIVVMALGSDGHVYLLEDLTGLYSPEGWGRVVVLAYLRWNADRIVAEQNFGGDMVRAVIHGARIDDKPVGQNCPVRMVNASRGKSQRAEPVSAMYERKMVHHVGQFSMLEDELTNFTNVGYQGPASPNRADALVWGASELFGNNLAYGLTAYVEEKQAEMNADYEARMKATMERLGAGGSGLVAKPIAKVDAVPEGGKQPTAGCPECGSVVIQAVSSGGKRCGCCGNQWSEDGPVRLSEIPGVTRATLKK